MAFGESINDFLGGMPGAGGLFTPPAQLNPTALPATAKPLLDAQAAEASMSPEDIKARNLDGTDQAQRFQRSPEQTARMSAALGMNPNTPMSQAIADRSQRAFGSNLANLNTRQNIEAPVTLADQQHHALQGQMSQQQFLNKQYTDQLGSYMNQQAARSKAISSIIQMGGLLGGHAAGSSKQSARPSKDEDSENYYEGNGGSSSTDTSRNANGGGYYMAPSTE